MTQLRKRATWALVIWSLAMLGLCIIFFSEGGANTFLEAERRVTLTRLFFTVGFILFFAMLFLTRRRAGGSAVIIDERDELIAKRALMIGFYVIMIYVFLISLLLYWFYKIHLITTVMPVGWVWFIGISTFFMGYISLAAATLILDKRMSGHGQR